MSRLTVGSIEGLTENSNVISVPTGHSLDVVDGIQVDGEYMTPYAGRRNLLYNGAMQIAQRGTSVAGITGTGYYTADRWRITLTTLGTWTQSVENDAPDGSGFSKSVKMLCTTANSSPAAGDSLRFRQFLEGQDLQRIAKGTSSAQQLTVSFWVKANVTGTYIIELFDNDNSKFVSSSYTVASSATWERKVVTFPVDTTGVFNNDNNASLLVTWWLGAGSNATSGTLQTSWGAHVEANRAVGQTNLAAATDNYWQITGVQLEVGDKATPFEHRSYGEELALCQRYYYKLVSGGAYTWFTSGWSAGTTLVNSFIQLPISMRTTPTTLDATGSFQWQSTSNATYSASSLNILATESSSTVVLIRMTTASQTAGLWGHLRGANSSDAAIGLGAEL